MKTLSLKGTHREGKGTAKAKQIRKQGSVPCVVYGGEQSLKFKVSPLDLGKFIYTQNSYLVDLDIEGKKIVAKLQDVQFHPVKEEFLHADFLELAKDKEVQIAVPVILEGLPKGVQQGGKLIQKARKLNVLALIDNLPDKIVIDVTDLELGKNIRVSDVKLEGFEIKEKPSNVVAQVKLTRAAMSSSGGEEETKEETETKKEEEK